MYDVTAKYLYYVVPDPCGLGTRLHKNYRYHGVANVECLGTLAHHLRNLINPKYVSLEEEVE